MTSPQSTANRGDEPAPERLRGEDVPEAAALMARAFRDNPSMVVLLDSDHAERRARLLARLMPVLVAAYAKHGVAWATRAGERLAGVALTLPPGDYPPSAALQLQLTLGVIRHMPTWNGVRLGVADVLLARRHLRGPHHYLFMLGVDPERQGQGHGGRLLRALSRCADDAGVPCYLETDKRSSMELYARYGYAVTSEPRLPFARDLALWFMQRPPSRQR